MEKLTKERTSTIRLGPDLDYEVDRLAADMDISRSQVMWLRKGAPKEERPTVRDMREK